MMGPSDFDFGFDFAFAFDFVVTTIPPPEWGILQYA